LLPHGTDRDHVHVALEFPMKVYKPLKFQTETLPESVPRPS